MGASIESLTRLRGGMNSQVFRCHSKRGCWVLKAYSPHQNGQSDRMKAEVDFLLFTTQVAPNSTPTLLGVDYTYRCVVMDYIAGEPFVEGVSPHQNDLDTAFSFFRQINGNPEIARKMIKLDAADGFLSLRQHMLNVRTRFSAMGTEHLPQRYKSQADDLLQQLHAWIEQAETRLEARISSGMVEDILPPEYCCVSPSDFGFHNAIRTCDGVKFIDFEFAGWDDPAKACADFTLQQRNPVRLQPLSVASHFFPHGYVFIANRISAIYELLRLKWLCIILGVLNPVRLDKMIEFKSLANPEVAVAKQLSRYRQYISDFPLSPTRNSFSWQPTKF